MSNNESNLTPGNTPTKPGVPNPHATRVTRRDSSAGAGEQAQPPTIQLKRPMTAKVPLAPASQTLRVQLSSTGALDSIATVLRDIPSKGETARISLDAVPNSKKQTARLSVEPSASTPINARAAHGETMRVSLSVPDASNAPQTSKFPRAASLQTVPGMLKTPADTSRIKPKSSTGPMLTDAPTAARGFGMGRDARKQETSRIILEDATTSETPSEPVSGFAIEPAHSPSTIRLKRPATSPISINAEKPSGKTTKVFTKSSTASISEAPTVMKTSVPSQRSAGSTSRIGAAPAETSGKTAPIPQAPPPVAQPPGGAQPRTIRLKRPSNTMSTAEAPAETPAPPVVLTAAAKQQAQAQARKGETSKIDLPKENVAEPITQRKTIKIKRTERNVASTGGSGGGRTLSISRTTGPKVTHAATETEEDSGDLASAAPVVDDDAGIVFSILAMVAMVIMASLVYILVAQGSGPVLCLPVPASLF